VAQSGTAKIGLICRVRLACVRAKDGMASSLRRSLVVVALLSGALASACGGKSVDDGSGPGSGPVRDEHRQQDDSVPPAASNDLTCTKDEECAAVFAGDVCGCACTMQAIAAKDVSRYLADQAEARAACAERNVCGPCAAPPPVRCITGACTL
jgi:hypothetical protein